jgi:hypothetical protein
MAFERFVCETSRGNESFASHYVSSGVINISAFAAKRYNLTSYKGVILFYDKEQNRIGFEFVNNQDTEGFKCVKHRRGNCVVSGLAFMKHFKLATFNRKPFQKLKDSFFIIDLN